MIGPWRIYPLVHTGEASLPNSYYMEAVSWHLSPIPTTTIFLHYSFQSSTLSLYFCYPSCLIKHMLSLSKETSNRQLPAPLTPSINKALRDLYNRLPHKPPFRALSSSGAFNCTRSLVSIPLLPQWCIKIFISINLSFIEVPIEATVLHSPKPPSALTMASQSPQTDPHISSAHKASNPDLRHPKFGNLPLSTSGPQDCALRGTALLVTPYFNKGAGFTAAERREFGLTGLLPQNVQTLDQQVKRAYEQYKSRSDPLAKNTFMTSLAVQNQVLFYRVSVCRTDCEDAFLIAEQIYAASFYKRIRLRD